MAKRVRVGQTSAGPFYTLPGNSAELRNEAGELTDTIFGQEFESTESGLIGYTINSNALYKGFAGYVVNLMKGGVPATLTDAAMSQVGATKTYVVTDTSKSRLDPATPIVVKDNAVDKTAEVESIDFLFGKVTFKSSYTVTGPVTISGKSIPVTAIAGAKSFTLTQTAAAIDNTDIPTAKGNGGFRTFEYGLKTVSLEMSGIYKASNGFVTALKSREPIFVEINPDGSNLSVCRGIFKYTSQGQSGDVGALEEETVALRLNVLDNDLWARPFGWEHSALTTLNQGIRIALNSWENNQLIYMHYLPDGSTGFGGDAVVTDLSLAGGLEVMNEFTFNVQGSGAPVAIP